MLQAGLGERMKGKLAGKLADLTLFTRSKEGVSNPTSELKRLRLPRRQELIWSRSSGAVANFKAASCAMRRFRSVSEAPPPSAFTRVFRATKAAVSGEQAWSLRSLFGVGVVGERVGERVGDREGCSPLTGLSDLVGLCVPTLAGTMQELLWLVVLPVLSSATSTSRLVMKLLRTNVGAPVPPNLIREPFRTRCGTAVAWSDPCCSVGLATRTPFTNVPCDEPQSTT